MSIKWKQNCLNRILIKKKPASAKKIWNFLKSILDEKVTNSSESPTKDFQLKLILNMELHLEFEARTYIVQCFNLKQNHKFWIVIIRYSELILYSCQLNQD